MTDEPTPLHAWPEQRLAELLTAYSRTDYCVAAPEGSLTLHVGELLPEQNLALLQAGVISWCVVTAWNPQSQLRSADRNDAAQDDLKAEIESYGLKWWEAAGRDPAGEWPTEESCFVLNISPEQTGSLCEKFGQLAALYGDAESEPWLLFPNWGQVGDAVVAAVDCDQLPDDVSERLQATLEQNRNVF
ncbi:MAG: DUF3293 domain-containing protein [Planctomycetaceae bacterium]|nr:DUF3293 domain-containing protein [Planctomycetaceae bacterium]